MSYVVELALTSLNELICLIFLTILQFMSKTKSYSGISIFFGLTFLSPITFAIAVYEMDVVQRVFFFSISLFLFLVFVARFKMENKIHLNKSLSFLFILFPVTFLTAFLNGSASLLFLKLSDLIIPLCILLQTVLLFSILGDDRFLKVVSYSVVIISTLFSVLGLLEVFQIRITQFPTVSAPGSTLGHRSFAAEYLLSSLPFFIILHTYIKKDKKIYLLIAAIVNVSFLLFTRNRSGIIILIAIVLFYIVFIFFKIEKKDRLKFLIPTLAVLLISFTISLIPVKVSDRPDLDSTAKTLFDAEFKSNVLRMKFWDASLQMIGDNPVSGIGMFKWSGHYPKYSGDYFTDETVTFIHNVHAHNDFLEIFSESGFLSALVFLLIYISVAYLLFKKLKNNHKYFPLLLTFLITFAYSLLAFPNYKFSSFFLAVVSAGCALIVSDEKGKNILSLKSIHLKWMLILMIIIGGITSIIRLQSEIKFGHSIFLKNTGQYTFMLQKLEEISEILYPLDASKQPVDYYRSIASFHLGNYPEALKYILKANELAPFNPIVMRNVAGLYEANRKIQDSINKYEQVRNYFPNYIDAQINLLSLYSETKQVGKAKELFDELIKKSPDNPRLVEYKTKYMTE